MTSFTGVGVIKAVRNSEVAQIFMEIADILDIMGEIPFKPRAYRKAAQSIKNADRALSELAQEGTLSDLPGVGKELSLKIEELLSTGKLGYYEKVKAQVPEGLMDLIKIPGVGPKTAKMLHDKLGIGSIGDLEEALKRSQLKGLPGFKEKSIENITKGLEVLLLQLNLQKSRSPIKLLYLHREE